MPYHDDVIKWKHFPRNWPFVRGIHRSPVNSPHKGKWRGNLTFSLICIWIKDWVKNREAGDLRRYGAHYDVIVMFSDDMVSILSHNDMLSKIGSTTTRNKVGMCHYRDVPWESSHHRQLVCSLKNFRQTTIEVIKVPHDWPFVWIPWWRHQMETFSA